MQDITSRPSMSFSSRCECAVHHHFHPCLLLLFPDLLSGKHNIKVFVLNPNIAQWPITLSAKKLQSSPTLPKNWNYEDIIYKANFRLKDLGLQKTMPRQGWKQIWAIHLLARYGNFYGFCLRRRGGEFKDTQTLVNYLKYGMKIL